ncbi:transposable element Tcb1 transposase [Trichonephila clavipes]|nr:transposable element Tcb1 transposase [Trichonephila clavipes]
MDCRYLRYTVTANIDIWHNDSPGKGCHKTVPPHITTLSCPALSPDFSPIEHICDHSERQVGQPTTLVELVAYLQKQWNKISQNIIRNLFVSMPARIASCIRARRGLTEY